jgi:hypothetical protein
MRQTEEPHRDVAPGPVSELTMRRVVGQRERAPAALPVAAAVSLRFHVSSREFAGSGLPQPLPVLRHPAN